LLTALLTAALTIGAIVTGRSLFSSGAEQHDA
jgi:hypothetical protein